MAEQFANNASTTLNGSINNSATSVVVVDGSVYPSSGNFRVICGTEIMLVTAISSNTLTVTRGVEGTIAVSHISGDSISHVYTKASLEQFISDMEQVGGYSSRPSSGLVKGQVYTANDTNAKWIYNGSNWDLLWPTYIPFARRYIPANWTIVNQSISTFTDKNGILEITGMPANTSAIRGITKSLPSSPYKATAIIEWNNFAPTSIAWYIGHRESSTGKCTVMYSGASIGGTSGIEIWNNFNNFSSTPSAVFQNHAGRVRMPRVENDGTNWNYYVGYDGKNWTQVFSHVKNSGMTTAADQIFVGAYTGVSFTSSGLVSDAIPSMSLLGYWED